MHLLFLINWCKDKFFRYKFFSFFFTHDQVTIKRINLSPELIAVKRSGTRGEIQYRLAWIRTKAKQNGLVSREVDKNWKITEKGKDFLSSNKIE